MSVRVMAMVWDSTVPAPARFTLLALADNANDEGRCWPSISTLARKCCTGESTIRRHLKALVDEGLITVQHRWNASSEYAIDLPRLVAAADPAPSQSDTPCQIDTPSQTERTPSQSDTPPPVKLSGPPSQTEHLTINEPSLEPSENRQEPARARAATTPADRGTRIPDDFAATPEMVKWARENTPHVNGRRETEAFIDYWRGKAGREATKVDWVATWRNWMRRAEKDDSRRPPRNGNARPTSDDRIAALQAMKTHSSTRAIPGAGP